MTWRILCATAVVLQTLVIAPSACAEGNNPSAGGGVNDDSFFVGVISPGQTGGNGSVGGTNGVSPYTYTWVPAGIIAGVGPICDANGAPGSWYGLVVRDLAGTVVSNENRCVPLNPDGGLGAPPALPPVPTTGDIWRVALRQIDAPRLGVNPSPVGLTGLETWLWYDGPSELEVAAGIGPWTVTGTARLAEVTFDLGDGETVTAARAGSEADPAARYVYETKGTYEVVVTARWTADFVLSGPGLPSRPTPMGSAVLRSTSEYPVQEVRGLLVPDR
jgi:hypothetical protein